MIIIRDLTDVHTLKLKIMQGDILEIYNSHYDITKYYWVYEGILTMSFDKGNYADYCYDSEFFRDIRMALSEPDRYFVKLVQDRDTEVIRLEENAVI